MPPKKKTTQQPIVRNTEGLQKFSKARDLALKKLGFPTFQHFTAAIRAVYDKQSDKGFKQLNEFLTIPFCFFINVRVLKEHQSIIK